MRELRTLRRGGMLQVVGVLVAALFALGLSGTMSASASTDAGGATAAAAAKAAPPQPAEAALPAAYTDCAYQYLCLWEGYNYTGTIHRLFNCQVYYTNYPIHSAYNHQTPGTRASFRDYNNVQFWVSPAPNWRSGNTDTAANGGSLNAAWYVKPC